MSVLGAGEHEPSGPSRRGPLFVAVLAAALVMATAAWWLTRPPAPVPPEPADEAVAPAPVEAPPPARPAPAIEPAPRETRRRTEPAPAPEALPAGPLLRVESDVPGAFVFVDRKFVGETPLETRDVPVGRHQLNVSAEGYDGVSRIIDIAEAGPTTLSIELKTVRLNASVPVVHDHGFGSCEGRLVATIDGLRYETAERDHAFQVPLRALDAFEVDYLEKNLRVKRDGRTWNFSTRADTADPLLVFHREVQHARNRLATGGGR